MKTVVRGCGGCVLLIVLAIGALIWMEHVSFGEPRQTLPKGLCRGELIVVWHGQVEQQIGMAELTPRDGFSLRRVPWKASEAGDTYWGKAVIEAERKIRVQFRDGHERIYPGPGPEVSGLGWSPDGHFIGCTYKWGPLGLGSGCGDSYAVGILDLATGTNYRLHVEPTGPVHVQVGSQVQWVSTWPPNGD